MTAGISGIIVPVLPTTPLLMLALLCFSKGSSRVANWFMKTKLYERYLKKYSERKGMTLKQKIFIQVFASVMMITSFIFMNQWALRGILLFAFLIHNYIFIFKIKTLKNETKAKSLMKVGCSIIQKENKC